MSEYLTVLPKVYDLNSFEYKTRFYSKLYHYTTISCLNEIKESHQFKANCITAYNEKYKECLQYSKEQDCLEFTISFSHKMFTNQEKSKFKNCNACAIINFSDNMYSVFDFSKPIITDTGDKLMWYNKEYSDYFLENGLKKNIGVDVKCIDPEYCSLQKLNKCVGEKTNVINYSPKLRLNENWQGETRYVFRIHSTKNMKIPKYKYLLIPIKTENFEFL